MGCCGWKGADRAAEVPTSSALRAALDQHRARAEVALVEATRGGALCRIDGAADLRSTKYAEGRLAAVAELQRRIRAITDPDEERAVARRVLHDWEDQRRAAEGRGVAWTAYRDGGVDELRAALGGLAA